MNNITDVRGATGMRKMSCHFWIDRVDGVREGTNIFPYGMVSAVGMYRWVAEHAALRHNLIHIPLHQPVRQICDYHIFSWNGAACTPSFKHA